MELYMQNIEHGRMTLESVEHGPLIWPMIIENGMTKTKKYEELSVTNKIQVDYDIKTTNIILQRLPSYVYSLVNHHRVAKDLWERVQLLMQVQGRQSLFTDGTSRTRANISGTSRNNLGQQRVMKYFNCQREGSGKVLNKEELEFLADPRVAEGPVTKIVITHNATYQENDLDAYDSDCDDFSTTKALLMANLSSYASDVLSEVPHSENTHNDMLNQIVQEMSYSEQTHLVNYPENDAAYQADDLDAYDSDYDDFSTAKAVLMANLSSYASDVLSEAPHSENTHNDMLNQIVQEMPYSEQTHFVNYPENEITSDNNIIPYSQHELCLIEFVSDMNASSKTKSVKKFRKKEEWKPIGKMFTKIGYNWRPTGRTFTLVRNACPLTRITATNKVPLREPIPLEFLGTVKFGNDQIAKIMGYDLKVAFRKHTCFVRNLEGVDLLSGSWETNLYTLSIGDMMASFPNFLLSKASKTKSCKKQSHKPKSEDTNKEKLYLLHMDLCGPMRVASINRKRYILVIMADYSWFTWVKFLASKDEAPDNGTEFVNQNLRSYYQSVGISHETLVARSPQQNGVVERRNRTLVEAARTMLIYVKAPLFLWAEAVATTCYTQYRSIIRRHHGKIPYELLHDRKPNLSHLHVFGALCYPNNDSKDLGKLQAKADIGIFIRYASKKKAYHIYNRCTKKINETIHVDFDELTAMASEQISSGPGLQSMTPTTTTSGLVPNPIPQEPFPVAIAPIAVDLADSHMSTSIDQDAPSTSIPSIQDQEHSPIIS
ncbi:retrovirus-related pol polyprotein from transposon TNT 1-94 [Tanacetum coccineum]